MLVDHAKDLFGKARSHGTEKVILRIVAELDAVHVSVDLVEDGLLVATEKDFEGGVVLSNVAQLADDLDVDDPVDVENTRGFLSGRQDLSKVVSYLI